MEPSFRQIFSAGFALVPASCGVPSFYYFLPELASGILLPDLRLSLGFLLVFSANFFWSAFHLMYFSYLKLYRGDIGKGLSSFVSATYPRHFQLNLYFVFLRTWLIIMFLLFINLCTEIYMENLVWSKDHLAFFCNLKMLISSVFRIE